MLSEPVLTVLQALECELHQPEVRRDRRRLAELIHPDFVEFGRSGRVYTQSEILEHLPSEAQAGKVYAQDFAVRFLSEDVALLTYQSAHVKHSDVPSAGTLERHTLRSSVWRLEAAGWKIVFHQGTPTEAFVQGKETASQPTQRRQLAPRSPA